MISKMLISIDFFGGGDEFPVEVIDMHDLKGEHITLTLPFTTISENYIA